MWSLHVYLQSFQISLTLINSSHEAPSVVIVSVKISSGEGEGGVALIKNTTIKAKGKPKK